MTMADSIARPAPQPNRDSKPYWDGLSDGRIMLQQCSGCGQIRHYPRPVCDRCYSMACDWVEASGQGTIHTWATSHHAFHPAFKQLLPITLITDDLEEGVRLCAPPRGSDPSGLQIGRRVRLGVEVGDDGLATPVVHLLGPPQ